jgi:hypothetical protein
VLLCFRLSILLAHACVRIRPVNQVISVARTTNGAFCICKRRFVFVILAGAAPMDLYMNANPSTCAYDPLSTFSTRLLCSCAQGLSASTSTQAASCLPMCSTGSYFSRELGACEPCTTCSSSEFEAAACGPSSDTVCASCGPGCVQCEEVQGALACAACAVGLVEHSGTCRSVR